MFYYSQGLGIQPKKLSTALEIGIFGHTLQKKFWRCILEGMEFKPAVNELKQLVMDSLDNPETTKIVRNTLAFVDWAYNEQGWRPLEVEQVHFFRMTDDMDFGMTPDMVFVFSQGINKGRQAIVDFKHVSQYWNEEQLNGYQQTPKYMRFLNENKVYHISKTAVAMLNTRAAQSHNNNLFLVKWPTINKEKLDRIAVENFRLALRVKALKEMPVKEMELAVNRTVNHYQCKLCSFADLCNLDFLGKDSSKLQAIAYEKNEYSYEHEQVRDEH